MMVRYGILGFGLHAVKRLVPAFTTATDSVLTGLWRRNLQRGYADAQKYAIPNVFPAADDLCASPEIDVVFVTSPDVCHMQDTLLAMSHHKPVLCEKPLAMHAGEVKRMLDAARAAEVLFGVAQNFRFTHSIELIREWVHAGRIGKPVFSSAHYYNQSAQSLRTWMHDPAIACGGVIGDIGIHCLDAMRFILQDDVVAVTAAARQNAQSGAVEADAALMLEFRQGTFGSVMVSAHSEYRTLVEVVGETGVIRCENCFSSLGSIDVHLLVSGRMMECRSVSNTDAHTRMLDHFSRAVQGRGSYSAMGEDGLKNQQVLDAAYRSWESGKRAVLSAL